jgi:N-methylhydantoinase A
LIDGNIGMTSEGRIGPYPVAVPMVNLHTIGAGGGSLAHVDAGGMLHVGPQSAGAMPGPACYSRGGTQATVTDANAVLGHLPASTALGGSLCIDTAKAYAAVKNIADTLACGVETAAQGIITVANEHMTRALRVISVEKGFDPRDFTLCCFGGAGGLHLCDIADALGMTRALVPIHGGVLSALGMLVAPRQRQLSQTYCCRIDHGDIATIDACFTRLQQQAIAELVEEGVAVESIAIQRQIDVRYVGQSYCLTLDWSTLDLLADEFHLAHQQSYGHRLARMIEIVTLRIAAKADATAIALEAAQYDSAPIHHARIACSDEPVPVYRREQLAVDAVISGPLIIAESTATTLVTEHWQVRRDPIGHLHLARRQFKETAT